MRAIVDPGPAEDRSQAGEDWAAFLGPQGDGTSREQGVDPGRWNPHPPILWTRELGISYGAPSIAGERVLQFDRFGSEERLSCLEASTGEEIWQWNSQVDYADSYGYNNGPRCCPVIDDGRVYTYGVAGQLSCVDLQTGKLLWTNNLSETYSVVQNFFGVASTPVILDDLLIVMVGGSPAGEAERYSARELDLVRPNGTAIVAFDKRTGEEKYRAGNDLASYASPIVRRINDREVGLAFLRSELLAFDARTGEELFSFPWRSQKYESVNAANPIVDENRILLSEAYEIGSVLLEVDSAGQPHELRRDTGRWRDLSFRAHWSTPILIDGYLYGCSGRNQPDCDFRCVRLRDGALQWSKRTHERSSVLAVDGYLIVLDEQGLLQLVEPSPEELRVVAEADFGSMLDAEGQRPLLQYPCWAAPVLSHGRLFLRGQNRLVCLDLIPVSATP